MMLRPNSGTGWRCNPTVTTILGFVVMMFCFEENILAALKRTTWKIAGEDGAAELLGIKPTTLASRMRKMGIERPV